MRRFVSLDLAKGFTVLFIPAIHSVMVFSQTSVHRSLTGLVLGFVAEWPGAQLLMFVMGCSFSFSKKPVRKQLTRAAGIFLTGYLLNALKFLLPLYLHLLPMAFLHSLRFSHNGSPGLSLLLLGDILQFAGLALLVMSILRRSKYYPLLSVFLGFAVILFAPLVWDLHARNPVADQMLHLLGGQTDDVFFPVFPWLVYPLTGLAVGQYLQWPLASIRVLLITGGFLLLGGWCIHELLGLPDTLFWRTWPDLTIAHLGFVLVWLCGWFWIGRRYEESTAGSNGCPRNLILLVLQFCGRHITLIYLVQWVVIFWLVPFVGYCVLDQVSSLCMVFIVYLLVFVAVLALVRQLRSR